MAKVENGPRSVERERQQQDPRCEQEKLSLEHKKLEIEEAKLRIERRKAYGIVVPIFVVMVTVLAGFVLQRDDARLQRELLATRAAQEFRLQAVDIVMNSSGPKAAKTKREALILEFEDTLGTDFMDKYSEVVTGTITYE